VEDEKSTQLSEAAGEKEEIRALRFRLLFYRGAPDTDFAGYRISGRIFDCKIK
jgi:hypothetical protein